MRACSAPRKPRCSQVRLMQPRAWAAPVSGVRGARCAPFAACTWRQSPRALCCCCALPLLFVWARFSSKFRLAHFHVHRTELCRFSSRHLLCLCGASSSFCLCVVSAFCSVSVLFRLRLCVRLVCASPVPFARRVSLQQFYWFHNSSCLDVYLNYKLQSILFGMRLNYIQYSKILYTCTLYTSYYYFCIINFTKYYLA